MMHSLVYHLQAASHIDGVAANLLLLGIVFTVYTIVKIIIEKRSGK